MREERLVTSGITILSYTRLDRSLFPSRCVILAYQDAFNFVHLSIAINLVNSTTTYAYDPRTRLYQQATFAFQTLQRLLTVNNHRLDQLKTTLDVELERRATIPVGTLLSDLVRAGIKERALAPTILTALMEELQKQTMYDTCIYHLL